MTAPQTAVWLSSWPSRAVCSCAIWAHCRCTRGEKVAYIGAFADHPRYSAGHPRAPQVTSAIDAAVLHDRKIHYIEGFPADRDQRDEAEFLRAVAAAEAADAAVIFAGLPECSELAAADRRHMRLPECQNNLIARVAAVQKNTVVVLHTSGPVECPWADDVSSVLCMYLAGEGLGEATDALLWATPTPAASARDLAPAAGGHALLSGFPG